MGARTPSRWLALALLTSCSAAPPPIDPVAPPDTIDVTGEVDQTPASGWRYHPRKAEGILDGVELPDGRWLLVGELGERWLTTGPARRPSGRDVVPLEAEAAAHRAGEPLEHVVPWRPAERLRATPNPTRRARWLFVGESGRSYFAADPLGRLSPGPTAPRPLAAVSPTRSGALAVDRVGRSLALDGAAWEPMSEHDRPRLFAIAQRRGGQLVAMGLPERFWTSDDDGARWSPLDTGPLGALRLVTTRAEEVVADGASGAWRLAGDGTVSPLSRPTVHPRSLVVDPIRGPSARAVVEGEAVMTHDGYVEMVSTEDGWNLRHGRLGERLETRPLPLQRPCDRLLVTAKGAHLWIACRDPENEPTEVHLFHSADHGRSLAEVATVISRLPERVSLTWDADGAALVSAVCPSHRPACRDGAPLRARPDGRLEPTVAPELRGPSFALASGSDGHRYFLGERAKDRRVALFVSRDGERFAAQPLLPPRGFRGAWDRELTTRRTLHPAADGTVGIAVQGTSPLYAVADRRGRIAHVATLPENTVALGGHGNRILALTKVRSFELAAHQSNDGGRTFRSISLPMALEVSELDEPAVACNATGCIIGDRVTRLGWNADDAPLRLDPPELVAADVLPAIRTPITCTTSGDLDTLTDVAEEPALPSPDAVMRGDVAWSVLRRVRATGEIAIAAMSLSTGRSSSRLTKHRLFAPSTPQARWATDVTIGPAGYAAARAELPARRDSLAGAPMALEVAWQEMEDGIVRRSVLPDVGAWSEADVTPGRNPTLVTGALALAPPGLLFRPSATRPDTWLLDGDGKVISRQPFPSFSPTTAPRTTLHAAHRAGTYFALQGHHLDVGAPAATVAVVPLGGPTAATNATTTVAVPALGRLFETHLSHRDGQPGIVSQSFGPDRNDLFGFFAPLLDTGRFGQGQPLPTQRDLGDAPAACTPTQRHLGLRVVAPFQTGTRHPVLVGSGNDRFAMLTERAVIRATADGPCLAGWVAVSIGHDPERLAILSGDLTEAWLLRQAGSATLAHRPMRCALTPDVEVPEDVWRESGTLSVTP